MSSRKARNLIGIFLFLSLLSPSMAQAEESGKLNSAWTEVPRPKLGKGLLMEPRLLSMGSRFHMVWTGTSGEVNRPELFHASLKGDDMKWKKPQAPYFGKNKGRVRKVAIGKTRNLIGVLFQRTLSQGNDAYEVLLAISSDQGWSWSGTIEIDQFVAEKTGGTGVSIEGRQGSNRPEFAMSWIREYGNVRAANFDIKSTLRPQGVLVGQHSTGADKSEVAALGKKGFSVVYNNGTGLATSHVKALIGKIEEGTTFLRGRYGKLFSVASRPFGPSRMVVASGDDLQALTTNDTSWKNDNQSLKLPFATAGSSIECDMDDDKDLHVAIVRPVKGKYELWYTGQKKKTWSEPELVYSFDDNLEIRGFDIAATKNRVLIAVSQGFYAKFFRRKQ